MIGNTSPSQILPDNGFAFAINPKSPAREAVASFVQRRLAESNDPATKSLPPLAGEDIVPHAVTFASLHGSYASVYLLPDESALGMAEDARIMRHDLTIMECLEIRQRLVAELDWTIEPPDENNRAQKALATELTEIVNSIRRFTEYRRSMQEAIWVGRSAIQHRYGWDWCGGRQYQMPKPLHKDHPGWMPIHGDKILFRFDDGRKLREGEYPHQMGIRVSTAHYPETRISERRQAEQTPHGMAIFLRPYERDTLLVHKHMIEDSDFHDMRTAGRIHGVGIRNRIWRTWILKQETLRFLMTYIERSAGGIEIWEYPMGNPDAKAAVVDAAERRSANGKNILYFPKPMGEDAALYDLKIVEPGFSGIDLINTLQEKYFGHQIKRYILGQTLTTEADATGLGSGVADAHRDTLHQIILYDGANHEETLSEELVRTIQLINFPETSRWRFKLKLKFDSEDSQQKLEGYRTAWDMGARIDEADVLDAIGASIPDGNAKILTNPAFQQQGGGSPFGTFPSGTGVVSAAVHQSVGSHIGGPTGRSLQDGDGDNDGIAGEGTPNQRPSFPDEYARQQVIQWDESEHPRDEAGRFRNGEKGAGFKAPAVGNRYEFDVSVMSDNPDDDGLVKVGNGHHSSMVPVESLHQMHSDLTGDLSYLKEHGPSGNEHVDAVINGQATMIGKGNDGVVFETPDGKIVKASTTVPYHPIGGPEHSRPDTAMSAARSQYETLMAMKNAGVSGIPETAAVEHGDKFFMVRDKLELDTPMSREQLEQVRGSVQSMHDAGYEIMDQLQVGIGKDGNAYHFDLGQAGKAKYDLRRRDEMSEVGSLWKKNGHTWHDSVDEAMTKADTFKRIAQRDIDNGKEVRAHAKESLRKAMDSLLHHDEAHSEAWDLMDWMQDRDLYARQRSFEWNEEEHPREPAGSSDKPNPKGGQFSSGGSDDSGRVKMRQAKAGGEKSDVTGEFYKGGSWMPVHGLHVGKEKPEPKKKSSENEGPAPTANPDGKGKTPTARKLTDEQIEEEKENQRIAEKWSAVQSGKIAEMLWIGDKPGKTGFSLKPQVMPFLRQLTNDQIAMIGDFAFDRVIENDVKKYIDNRRNGDSEITRDQLIEDFNEHAGYTADLFLTKKDRKDRPAMERAIEAIRQFKDLPDAVANYYEFSQQVEKAVNGSSPEKGEEDQPEVPERKQVKTFRREPDGSIAAPHKAYSHPTFLTGSLTDKGVGADYPEFGALLTPDSSYSLKQLDNYETFGIDNGVFGGSFDPEKFDDLLHRLSDGGYHFSALFAVAPDVFDKATMTGDAAKTIERSRPWFERIRNYGIPAAMVAQDGLEEMIDEVPWSEFDVLFLGGSDDFKMGRKNSEKWTDLIDRAKSEGKRIHVGRVNSKKRLEWAASIGADSVDGTYLAYGPEKNVKNLKSWMESLRSQARAEAWQPQKRLFDDKYARRSHRILKEAAAKTHTEPTEAQAKAGNYSKGVFPWNGLEISIENPKGSNRRGCSPSGATWERQMTCHYGYFRRTNGADGDQLDVFIGAHPESELVYVIKQVDKSGKFDEFKCVIGCNNWKQARKAYLSNYPKGWKLGPKAGMTVDQFKRWLEKGGGKNPKSFPSENSK